jgi:peroxiredoxin
MWRSQFVWFVLMCVLAGVLVMMLQNQNASWSRSIKPVQRGEPMPSFSLPKHSGGQFSYVQGSQKEVLLLHFWASWCEQCQLEAPALAELSAQYGNRLRIVGVNARSLDHPDAIESFVRRYALTYDIVYDEDGALASTVGLLGFPYAVIVDKRGRVQETIVGYPGKQQLSLRIDAVLAKQ